MPTPNKNLALFFPRTRRRIAGYEQARAASEAAYNLMRAAQKAYLDAPTADEAARLWGAHATAKAASLAARAAFDAVHAADIAAR